ncbi:nucleoside-diphosphate kinase [candidate division KSB1 bacterium]|nr:nucleoside-diphosphate kinase [candidate division KSB1 bacterium]
MFERTLLIIKPDGVGKGHIGDIIRRIEQEGFIIRGMRMVRLSRDQAADFYAVHRGKPFYEGLLNYVTSGRVVLMALEGEDAVSRLRRVIGATDPAQADPGTLRKLYAENIERNAVHGSDSPENGVREVAFFFKEEELC